MKKLKYFFILSLLLALLAALCSCGAQRLAAPSKFEIDEENVLSWEEIDGASRYRIEIVNIATNDTITETWGKEYYDLSGLEQGNYDIKLQSIGDGRVYSDSDWSEILEFEKKYETGCIYKLIEGRTAYEISKAGKAAGSVYIEDEYRGKPVTSIADAAFKSKKTIVEVHVGANVTKIGKNAFYNCGKLETVTLPEGLQTIGISAFNSCSQLKSVNIPASVEEIGDFTFSYCRQLESIPLQEGLKTIGEDAFSHCSEVTELVIPDSVTSIADGAFKGMTSLVSVKIGANLSEIPSNAFYGATALTTVTFTDIYANGATPSPEQKNKLTKIGAAAFEDCTSLTTITIPKDVESLGNRCFFNTTLLGTVNLPDTINSVGKYCFNKGKIYTDSIEQGYVYVGDWLVSIATEALLAVHDVVATGSDSNNLSGFVVLDQGTTDEKLIFALKENVVGLADGVFAKSMILDSVDLPKSVKYVGIETFADCPELVSFRSPKNGVKTIGEYAFAGCTDFKRLYLENGLETIGSYAFYKCGKLADKPDLIPDTVTKIGTRAFEGTDLWTNPTTDTSGLIYAGNWVVGYTTISNGAVSLNEVVGISDYAFYECASLTSVEGLKDVTYIGKGAFYGCSKLARIQLNTDITKIEDYVFYKCSNLGTVVAWPGSLQEIGRSAFYKCESLKKVDLSGTEVHTIGPYAFYGCTALSEVEHSSFVKTIGDYSFYKCNSLKTVVVPDSVERIGVRAYYKCEALETVVVGSVETIDEYAFYGCSALKALTIKDGVKTIGRYAFYKCSALQVLRIGKDVEKIGDFAFFGAESLVRLVLPENIVTVGKYAFKGASSLTSVLLKANAMVDGQSVATVVEANAFYGCNLMTVYTDAVKTADGKLPASWHYRWNSGYRPVVWGCILQTDENGSYVHSVTIDAQTLDNVKAAGGFAAPERTGFTFDGWKTQDGTTYTAAEIVDVPVGTTLYAVWS